ncbi:histidine phosphatase family protein [Cupriavidus sp. AU9028]|uniref:SixA phosphatase family protein n=1 Tax=Cupriavidus sp. AU9028 TaxID=2871157 RepID=UPI001C945BF1|nr:histidine phosphatase family protein [Cupriavidus sp. AU9028]MBY4896235.1 histidine phosphatase family protein [Cupriavidus sp. AU9028]
MNLILWRHADAEALPETRSFGRTADLQRALTRRGLRQAELSAKWLKNRLPADARVLCSPAQRCRQTAAALGFPTEVLDALSPEADAATVLRVAGWPKARGTVVVVGHQPWLGATASRILAGQEQPWSVHKGCVWWFGNGESERPTGAQLRAVIDPDWL